MAHPNVLFRSQAVGLVLVLLNFLCYFCYFAAFAEVDDALGPVRQKVRVALFSQQDVGQVHAWWKTKHAAFNLSIVTITTWLPPTCSGHFNHNHCLSILIALDIIIPSKTLTPSFCS